MQGGIKRRVAGALLLCVLAALALWQAGPVLLVAPNATGFEAKSFHPAPGAEPISPIPASLPLDARKVVLGKQLFHDKRLSGDGTLSCASCHDLARGGVDGRQKPIGVGGMMGDLNTPTVFNSAFSFRQFWDGRAATLEEQVDGPLENPKEMASSWPATLARIGADPQYAARFREIYGSLKAEHVKDAIAEFERSLLTPGSRFDRYLQGDKKALRTEELEGYRLFKNYGCVACHQGVNVGGNLYQRLGVFSPYYTDSFVNQAANRGRAAVTGKAEDLHVFKVPSLRNVALTAPYFHDGSVATLEQAVLIMGQYQLGVVIPASELTLIVAFLRTLTGEQQETRP